MNFVTNMGIIFPFIISPVILCVRIMFTLCERCWMLATSSQKMTSMTSMRWLSSLTLMKPLTMMIPQSWVPLFNLDKSLHSAGNMQDSSPQQSCLLPRQSSRPRYMVTTDLFTFLPLPVEMADQNTWYNY